MQSGQMEKKDDEQEMMQVNLLDCIKDNKLPVLKFLIANRDIFFDQMVGNDTVLSYAQKTPGVSKQTVALLQQQQQEIEKMLPGLPAIVFNIINHPISIDENHLKLYQDCNTLNEGIRTLVIMDKIALLSMKQKNSLLRQILPHLDYDDALVKLNKREIALQKNDIFMSSIIGFNNPKLLELAKDPNYIATRMKKITEEKKDQSLSQKLVNYASTYCIFAPDRILFKDQPEFVDTCKEKVKELSDEVMKFLYTLKGRSQETFDYYKTIIIYAYEDVDAGFLYECLKFFEKLKNPTHAEKINLAAWKAVIQKNDKELAEIVRDQKFDVFSPNPHIKDSEETLLHHAVLLGDWKSLIVLLSFIQENNLESIYSASKTVAEEKTPLTPAELAFKFMLSPKLSMNKADQILCFKFFLEASRESAVECQKLLFEKLATVDNAESDIPIKALITQIKSITIGVYRCTFAIKFPNIKIFVVQPDTPLYLFLVENKKDIYAIIERDKTIIKKIEEDKLQFDDVDIDDMKIKNLQGKPIYDIAVESKSTNAITILTKKKKQQAFAHQLNVLDGEGLYRLVMNRTLDNNEDKECLDFFASHHVIAKKARLTLITWIRDNIDHFSFRKTINKDFEQITAIFSAIYQHDTVIMYKDGDPLFKIGKTPCNCLDAMLAAIKSAKEINDLEAKDCQNAYEIFTALIENKVDNHAMVKYCKNLELLTIIKDKIAALEDIAKKIKYYYLIFYQDDELPPHQLHKVFHWFKLFKTHEHQEHLKLLCDLYGAWVKAVTPAKEVELIPIVGRKPSSSEQTQPTVFQWMPKEAKSTSCLPPPVSLPPVDDGKLEAKKFALNKKYC